ncbi:hypothetical protein BJ138DRAFT_1141140 [Hygrophoropsis aurantiaca]|uniref:Uncharacterized protein n=1 Tax=Hygrophoropsis aurantiaca TaxID=72124 RepID=A0ACB8AQQ3_9AGAM|nr:hypothetical protein BJ138DRAFT_1141140 [Hygrophoropsis aurantiaca]
MSLRALVYAYVLGGLTFIPLVILGIISFTIYTSVPVGELDAAKDVKAEQAQDVVPEDPDTAPLPPIPQSELNDMPRTRKGWLLVRRTFEESSFEGSYVTLVRSFLDARSKDPKRSRPKDTWYVVLKGKVLYLYEDEGMTEIEAVIELGGHDVVIYPEGLLDGELFTRRNAICLKPKPHPAEKTPLSATRETELPTEDATVDERSKDPSDSPKKRSRERERLPEEEKRRDTVREDASHLAAPWFIFVRSCSEMEDWYLALLHASDNPANTPTLTPLQAVFLPSEMNHLVNTLDEQPDVIPMRWLNALLGRLFFTFYRTQVLESYIIGRLMKKLSKVKRPAFLTDIVVTQFSVGNKAPTLSKPMLKELTKEGDASLEVRLSYIGEIRATVEATATINLGARFKSYTVKLVLAVVLRKLEGNLLVKVKRPPSTRIWYAFTQTPHIELEVEPIVSDRQITWSMILNTIESRLKEIIQESVVLPNMDDISFFDSSQYIHRGGLWSDASRREKPEAQSLLADDASTPDSATQPAVENEPPTLKKSHSAEDLVNDPSSLEGVPVVKAATASGVTGLPDVNPKASRRRSWFSNAIGDDSDIAEGSPGAEENAQEETERGRRTREENSSTPRSRSIPDPTADVDVSTPHIPTEVDHDEEHLGGYLSPEYSSRSASAHSHARSRSSRAYSISSSTGGDDLSSNYLSDSSATSKSQRNSIGPSTTTSSFLSTLKSKAGDKQALSNSAKEAMRKWGVNWGGLKKDNSANGSQEDMPDVGSSDPRARTESNNLSRGTRPSYAEVRAAVAERKDRDKAVDREEPTSDPIPIPAGAKDKARSTSTSSRHSPSTLGVPASPGSPLPRMDMGISEGSSSSKFAAPSISRTATDNSSHDPFKDRDLTEGLDDTRASAPPIHTQPSQARTMTIPGIHASHRGEVMSMGYVAPVSPPPENKPKAPAIQSVYRLWKSPILAGQQQGEESQSASRLEGAERNKDVAPLSLSSEPASPPSRPLPPPLPPRTISSVAVRHSPDDSKNPADSESLSMSSASEALKTISSIDETKRMSVEQSPPSTPSRSHIPDSNVAHRESTTPPPTLSNKPPLPPRRPAPA